MESKKISGKVLLILILIAAASIRFYRLPEYLQFLGDQGRDLLVVKDMIVNHKFTLLGPTASVGGFYTGPIYYYFMLPFLWLSNLHPVGSAVMAVLFGLATIVLVYYFVKDLAGEKAGLISALLMAVSPKMIDISRFSWNPNPVPFFSLAGIYALYKRWVFVSGICLGILVQLHYIDLVFGPILGLALVFMFKLKDLVKQILLVSAGFIVGNSMFLLFELRHGFPNTKSVVEFIFRGGQTVAPRSFNFIELFMEIYRRTFENVFQVIANPVFNLIIYSSLLVFIYFSWKNRPKLIPVLTWLVVGILGLGFYRGALLEHYFNFLYILPFVILGVVISRHKVFYLVLPFLIYLSIIKWYIFSPPNNLVEQTQAVDRIVMQLVDGEDFNFALITPGNSDHAYRYFLEIWGKTAKVIYNPDIDPMRISVTNQLIVVCEGECEPLGNPLWEVAGFGRAEIKDEIAGPAGIKVYKLVHYKG